MNKLTTLVSASLLGISSLAAAQPAKSAFEIEAHATLDASFGTGNGVVIIHDNRAPVRPEPRPLHPNWSWHVAWPHRPAPAPAVIVPSSPWIVLGTVGTGTQMLRTGDGRFDTLMLDVDGYVALDKVVITFGDGQKQVVEFDRILTGASAMPMIDLAARNRKIEKVMVYSKPTRRGLIRVLARRDSHKVGTAPAPTAWSRLGTVSTGMQRLAFDDMARFDLLKLKATGRVHLIQVTIKFGNGEIQVVPFNKDLTGTATINLSGEDRRIASVMVSTTQQQRGELTLFAL